jgi:hypothetical protein
MRLMLNDRNALAIGELIPVIPLGRAHCVGTMVGLCVLLLLGFFNLEVRLTRGAAEKW